MISALLVFAIAGTVAVLAGLLLGAKESGAVERLPDLERETLKEIADSQDGGR